MQVLGSHKVSLEAVRRLAIECHALDSVAYSLLSDSIHQDANGRTRAAYEELLTERLLTLAIALRTKFYQGMDVTATARYANDCGLLYHHEGEREEGPLSFTLKDVCDKIIHADRISKSLGCLHEAKITELFGTVSIKGKKKQWSLSLSVTLLTEGILNWVAVNEETKIHTSNETPCISTPA